MTLTASRMQRIESLLDTRYRALLEEVRGELENSENLQYIELIDRGPADIGDQSLADTLSDLNVAITDRHVQEIREIETARARIRAHEFGICSDCGETIPFERLLAYPTAARCMPCQRQRERTYSHDTTPTL